MGNVGVDSDSGYVGLGMAGDECDKRSGLGVCNPLLITYVYPHSLWKNDIGTGLHMIMLI